MQTRRSFLMLPLCAAACTRAAKPLRDALPEQLPGGWKRASVDPLPAEETPAVVRALGLKQAVRATYRGAGAIRLRLFEMNVEASAFELIQKWRQRDGLAAYSGRYFFVAQSDDAGPALLSAFLQALQGTLKSA